MSILLLGVLLVTGLAAGVSYPAQAQEPEDPGCAELYLVEEGDTIYKIGRRFEIDIRQILDFNQIPRINHISPGTEICIPEAASAPNVPLAATGEPIVLAPQTQASLGLTYNELGQTLTVTGMNFPELAMISIWMSEFPIVDPPKRFEIGQTGTDATGVFTQTLEIPFDLLGAGQILVEAQDLSGQVLGFGMFQNQAAPRRPEPMIESTPTPTSDNPAPAPAGEPDDDSPGKPVLIDTAQIGPGSDVTLSRDGVGAVVSGWSLDEGNLELRLFDPQKAPGSGLTFIQPLLSIQVLNERGRPIDEVQGIVFVFYEMNAEVRAQANVDRLAIFRYDEKAKTWSRCVNLHRINNDANEFHRLACMIDQYGLYGLVVE